VKFFLTLIFSSALISGFAQQGEVLSVKKINKLVPGKIKEYALKESKSNQLKFGDITYSLCERIFIDGENQ
jgi:hypothetical protein